MFVLESGTCLASSEKPGLCSHYNCCSYMSKDSTMGCRLPSGGGGSMSRNGDTELTGGKVLPHGAGNIIKASSV